LFLLEAVAEVDTLLYRREQVVMVVQVEALKVSLGQNLGARELQAKVLVEVLQLPMRLVIVLPLEVVVLAAQELMVLPTLWVLTVAQVYLVPLRALRLLAAVVVRVRPEAVLEPLQRVVEVTVPELQTLVVVVLVVVTRVVLGLLLLSTPPITRLLLDPA
jgi:hypothetical protein